jgi:soluble lytic murein transglycosylase
MLKKNIWPALIMICVVLWFLVSCGLQETAGLPDQSTSYEAMLTLLREAEENNTVHEESLAFLSLRGDAIGFASSILLAKRLDAADQDTEDLLRQALTLVDSREARLLLAQVMETKGDRDGAIEQYLLLLPDSPAVEAMGRLPVDAGQILSALSAGGHWQAVLDYLAADNTANPAEYGDYRAAALAHLGEYEQALPILSYLVETEPAAENVFWLYARALEAAGDQNGAIIYYQKAGAEGAHRLGRIYEQNGEKQKAAQVYDASKDGAVLWRSAVIWEELDQYEKALTIYRQLAEKQGSWQDDAQFRLYSLLVQANEEEADDWLTKLKARPAWMDRLGLQPEWPEFSMIEFPIVDIVERLEAYEKAGRIDLVLIELEIRMLNAAPEEKIALSLWYQERAEYREAVRWGIRALWDVNSSDTYRLAYPRPYTAIVEQAAAEFNLHPALLWAVMREESRFQYTAVSRAGALGLMQVMPATGRKIAQNLQTEYSEADLLNPAVNIRFGAFYLRQMLDNFDQDIDRALAAYNAGPGHARRWSKSPLAESVGGYPAAVGFAETREYITRVREVYLTYLWLYE